MRNYTALMEMTPLDVYKVLKSYDKYEVALQDHLEINKVLLRLGFFDFTQGFYDFLAMKPRDIGRKYPQRAIKLLELDIPIELIVSTLINLIKQRIDNDTKPFCNVKQKVICNELGISDKFFRRELAKYSLVEAPRDYLNYDQLLNLIKKHIIYNPLDNDFNAIILNEITKPEEITINERTIIKHAINYDSFESFCNSFNGVSRNLINKEFRQLSIFLNKKYEMLTFTLLKEKIEEFRVLGLQKNDLYNHIKRNLGTYEDTLLSEEEAEQKLINAMAIPCSSETVIEVDADLDQNPPLQHSTGESISDENEALEAFIDDDFHTEFIMQNTKEKKRKPLLFSHQDIAPEYNSTTLPDETARSLLLHDNESLVVPGNQEMGFFSTQATKKQRTDAVSIETNQTIDDSQELDIDTLELLFG